MPGSSMVQGDLYLGFSVQGKGDGYRQFKRIGAYIFRHCRKRGCTFDQLLYFKIQGSRAGTLPDFIVFQTAIPCLT